MLQHVDGGLEFRNHCLKLLLADGFGGSHGIGWGVYARWHRRDAPSGRMGIGDFMGDDSVWN